MDLFREFRGFFCSVTQSEGGKHISFGCNAYTGTSSLTALLIYLTPKIAFGAFHFVCFGIGVDLLHDSLDLFKFQIDDVVHDALSQYHMFFEQVKVKIGIRFERIDYI